MKGVSLVFALFALSTNVNAARILAFFCQAARSHHIVYQPILKELAERGHQVDYYTHSLIPDPPANLKQNMLESSEEALGQMEGDIDLVSFSTMSTIYSFYSMRTMKFAFFNCSRFPVVQELLASDVKYDMVIGEFFFMQEDYSVFIHKFRPALGVAVSSVPDHSWINEIAGLPDNPAYMVSFGTNLSDKMTFLERVKNTVNSVVVKLIDYWYVWGAYQQEADNSLRYKGWESRPPILELSRDLALILTNSHPSLGYPYPKAPHVKEIMGTNIVEKPDPLPMDLQEYMDTAEHGVVYFSMGTIVSVKLLRQIGAYDAFINVFKGLKEKVIWKWTSFSGEEMPNIPNIKMAKWVPQQSILAHNKTKLFITHGGLGGLTEAIYAGVPMVALPVFGDQFKNTKLMSSLGTGVELFLDDLSEKKIHAAVHEVLDKTKYKKAAEQRSALFKDRPMKPVQEAVYWIEYVLKHGKVLQPAAVRLPIYQLYLLDVIAFLALVVLVSLSAIYKIVAFAKNKFMPRTVNVSKSKKLR